jgi:hypothetical protein
VSQRPRVDTAMRKKCAMYAKKQLTIIAVAALLVSVSLFYGVEPSMGMASGASLTTAPANASHAGTNDQKNLSTVSARNASPSSIQASDQLGASAASSAPTKVVTATTTLTLTTLTATVSKTTAASNETFTVIGRLTTNGSGISYKAITLERSTDNVTFTPIATISPSPSSSYYGFSRNESAAGPYYYRTTYPGTSTYANATSNVVKVTVGSS